MCRSVDNLDKVYNLVCNKASYSKMLTELITLLHKYTANEDVLGRQPLEY